jgi:nitrate/nitrite transport system permease protein
MSLPAHKFEPDAAIPPPAEAASVLPLPRRRPGVGARVAARASAVAGAVLPPLVTLALVLGVWQLFTAGHPEGFPSPVAIWADSRQLILHPFFKNGGVDQGLFWHVLTSLQRVAIGFSLSAVVGVSLGLLIGASRWAHRGLDPIFQVLRTVPPLAWLPISLAIFRQAQPSALFVIFITSVWPIVINTAVGVRNIPQDYVNVGRVLRLSPLEFVGKIFLPAATPYIFTGLRIGVGMSWLAIVASEMLLGGVGIGFFIWDQYNASRITDIVVALVWVGLVGFALDRFIAFLGRLVSRGVSAS